MVLILLQFLKQVFKLFFICKYILQKDDYQWSVVKPDVYATIMDFYSAGKTVINEIEEENENHNGQDKVNALFLFLQQPVMIYIAQKNC